MLKVFNISEVLLRLIAQRTFSFAAPAFGADHPAAAIFVTQST
jgi:hypothetical protein